MKKLSTLARYLLGLIYLLSGIAGLLNLIPPPPEMPAALQQFMAGMIAAKYFFPLLKGTEFLCGLFLLLSVAPALMLLILAPITLHVFLVHAFLTPGLENLVIPVLLLVLHSLSSVNYWALFRPLLSRKPIP